MMSRTGYGRKQHSADGREITLEIKTVNHRFLDISMRLPRALSFAEDAVRRQIGESLTRGHADVFLNYTNTREDAREVRVDEALAAQYKAAFEKLSQVLGQEGDILSLVASQPDVLTVTTREEDQEAVSALLRETLADVLSDVVRMRGIEGEALKKDLTTHLDALAALRDEIESLAPGVPKSYQEKLRARLKELGVNELDEQRLAQEVALMADHCAIDEELSRIASHIAQMREAMVAGGEAGRRLDFLTQELNREVNTIGSKASDAAITKLVVRAKSEIEKLREQVQNVE